MVNAMQFIQNELLFRCRNMNLTGTSIHQRKLARNSTIHFMCTTIHTGLHLLCSVLCVLLYRTPVDVCCMCMYKKTIVSLG